MDEIFKLIEMDLQVQENLLKAHDDKLNLKKKIEAEKTEISENSWTSIKQKVENQKFEIESKRKATTTLLENGLKDNIECLEKTFNDNYDKWVEEIVRRCIK